ncbi:histone deacetylase family protein [Rhodobacterales bacterium HKCCE3408]|nr:histone deacetylase family protein [Rhodobacterales bacterium HKCCE3408]
MVLLIDNPASDAHATPAGHPEQVARMAAIRDVLADPFFDDLMREEAPVADEADLLLCHSRAYVDRIRDAIPEAGPRALDPDTFVAPGSWEAAMRGVGGVLRAVDAVLTGETERAFVASRPPGHHAETATPMGFCLFGNVALGAKHALERHGLDRVAVVDFDVHHGNGTQNLLWNEPRALFFSSHQMPLWPGTGAPGEKGASGNVVNLPLSPGSGSEEMRRVYEERVFTQLKGWKPQLILISAGFDAHTADPLANLNWSTKDYSWLTTRLCEIADSVSGGRVVSALEGGYDLTALAASVAAHVAGLMERER